MKLSDIIIFRTLLVLLAVPQFLELSAERRLRIRINLLTFLAKRYYKGERI